MQTVLTPEQETSLHNVGTISYLLHAIVAVGTVVPGFQPGVLLLVIVFPQVVFRYKMVVFAMEGKVQEVRIGFQLHLSGVCRLRGTGSSMKKMPGFQCRPLTLRKYNCLV